MPTTSFVPLSEIHIPAPFISRTGQAVVIWIGLALSVAFVVTRTYIQYRHNKQMYANDWIIFFALVMHCASAVVAQYMIPPMYELQDLKYIIAGGGLPPANAVERGELYLRCQFALLLTLWTTLWAIKFSLLFFFWRLFDSLRTRIRIFWYIMCAITASTYIVTFFMQLFACGKPSTFFNFGATGCHTDRQLYLSNLVFLFSAGTDIAGDAFLLCIPIPLLWKLQVGQRQKIILLGIFLLPIIPIIFGILRLVFCNPVNGSVDVIKFTFYSMLENAVAIITACLPSMRLFFLNRTGNTTAQTGPPNYGRSNFSKKPSTFDSAYDHFDNRDRKGAIPLEHVVEARRGEIDLDSSHSNESRSHILQKGVMVTREYTVTEHPSTPTNTADEREFGRAV